MSEEEEAFDVVVVGAGPAGLNAAIMCATRNLNVLLLEREKLGGLLASIYPNKVIPNYPGFPSGVVSIELVRSWVQHLRSSGVTVKDENVTDISPKLKVTTNKREYRPKAIVIATGTRPRHLGLRNEERLVGKGVYYFPVHPEDFLGKKTLVVGGGDTAIDATLELLNLADKITLIHRREAFRAFDDNVDKIRKSGTVEILMQAELTAIKGQEKVEAATIRHENKTLEKEVDAIVISVGLIPNSEAFKNLGLTTDEAGFILTDNAQRTIIEGVFAAGDVTHTGLRLITVATSHGAVSSHYIYSYVKKPYWAREAWPTEIKP